MIASADVWSDMTDAERADWTALLADVDDADQWADAEAARGADGLEWPTLHRAVRALGGINGLGHIAQHDMPGDLGTPRDARGRLLRRSAACAYDELGFALTAAGLGDQWADMDGEAVLAELWRAWDAWDAHLHGAAGRSDVVPDVALPAATVEEGAVSPSSIRERTVGARAADDSGPVTDAVIQNLHHGAAGQRHSAPRQPDPLPEPDAADVDAYALAEAFGAIGEPDGAWEAAVLDARRAARERAQDRQRQRARNLAAAQRAMAEADALRSAATAPSPRRRPTAPHLRVLPPVAPLPAAPPSARAHAVMVAAILATFAASAALFGCLVASITGASVPGIVWTLSLTLPAIGAGVLPVALPAWRVPTVSLPVTVRVERRRAA